MNRIAKKIIELRKQQGLSQEGLAERAEINLRTIQRIENSENVPRGRTLNLISDALEINVEELLAVENETKWHRAGSRILNVFFLITLNLVLMFIIGYLTIDSNSNLNSRTAALLLSFFIPIYIVSLTRDMSGLERVIKFGIGYFSYFILGLIFLGFPFGFKSVLFPCLLISVIILYVGDMIYSKS